MRRSFSDRSAAVSSISDTDNSTISQWFDTTRQGGGLPDTPGVYRFRVPMEHQPDDKIEFLALLRWRRHGIKSLLLPTFEYFVDDEFITIPEGTQWAAARPGDQQLLSPDVYPILLSPDIVVRICPFCRKVPVLAGHKVCLRTGDRFTTSLPYRFNQFWFTCCEWIAPAPRPTIEHLISDWNAAVTPVNHDQGFNSHVK